MAKQVLEMEVKSNIGDVSKGINEAADATGKLKDETNKLDDATQKGSKGFKGVGMAVKGVGGALKAAGIGIVVALLAKLFEVISQNQKVVDAMATAMEFLSIAFNDLFKLIANNAEGITNNFKKIFEDPRGQMKEFGEVLKEQMIERFESLLALTTNLGKSMLSLFKGDFQDALDFGKAGLGEYVDVWTGTDDTIGKLGETLAEAGEAITTYADKTLDAASAIVAARKAAQFAELEVRRIQAENLKLAEDERQIRDNVNNTFEERIAANDRLSVILKEQQEAQMNAISTEIHALQLATDINASDENKIALASKQIEQLELIEAINGQISEQKTNQVGLENELRDAKQQTLLAGLEGGKLELESLRLDYEAKVELARKAGEDIVAITDQYSKEVTAIAEAETQKQKDLDKLVQAGKVDMAQKGLTLITAIAGESSAVGKAAAIAQTTISGIQSVQAAFTSGSANAPMMLATGGTYGFISAGLAGAFSALQLAKITSSGGGGGGGGGGGSSASAPPSPQMMSGSFDLSGGIEPEPVKAFVLTDEMSNSQNQLANIRRRATI